MTSFLLTLLEFIVPFYRGLKDSEFRAIFISLVGLIICGVFFYSSTEGWGIIDSVYFCVMTLATVGYGDLHPTGPISNIFTILYLIIGTGLFVAFITKIAGQKKYGKMKSKDSRKEK